MPSTELKRDIEALFAGLRQRVAMENGEWTVKGFIDVYRRIYTISIDTKVVSKIIELMMFPILEQFAAERGFEAELAAYQNHYPDFTLTAPDGMRFALDIKTTYRLPRGRVSGMTLGSFTGYFRDRRSTKNITYPYESYAEHLALGVIYSRKGEIDERQTYTIEQLADIPSVAHDFEFFIQEKYRIARDHPGSGNTKNIGSVTDQTVLINGEGPFASLGRDVFDDYWMYYLTNDMARAAELPRPPYRNLDEYLRYRGLMQNDPT
jgi:hypothetical protein